MATTKKSIVPGQGIVQTDRKDLKTYKAKKVDPLQTAVGLPGPGAKARSDAAAKLKAGAAGAVSPEEMQRGADAAGRRSDLTRLLDEAPGAARREAARGAALNIRGGGRGLGRSVAMRGAGIGGEAAAVGAGIEATQAKQDIAKQAAEKKTAAFQEIQDMKAKGVYDKQSVLDMMGRYGDDAEMVKYITDLAEKAPGKSQSAKDKDRNLGDDVKDALGYIGIKW
tara:strand:+ start:14 stop:685 length:672 start_codon:yes stop_codon:yes gene_type:complete